MNDEFCHMATNTDKIQRSHKLFCDGKSVFICSNKSSVWLSVYSTYWHKLHTCGCTLEINTQGLLWSYYSYGCYIIWWYAGLVSVCIHVDFRYIFSLMLFSTSSIRFKVSTLISFGVISLKLD